MDSPTTNNSPGSMDTMNGSSRGIITADTTSSDSRMNGKAAGDTTSSDTTEADKIKSHQRRDSLK